MLPGLAQGAVAGVEAGVIRQTGGVKDGGDRVAKALVGGGENRRKSGHDAAVVVYGFHGCLNGVAGGDGRCQNEDVLALDHGGKIIPQNDLAAGGAEPVGLMLTALLPPEIEEAQMRQMVQMIAQECEPLQVQILGGHTEVTDAVKRPVVSIAAVGKAKKGMLSTTTGAKPGDDIVVTKWIALEATAKLARSRREALLSRYPRHLLDDAERFQQYFSVIPEAATAVKSGVRAMHDVTTGGIFGALWELAEASGVGLEIELKKIPIRQETVEICEFFDLNPYQLGSTGSLLLAAPDGNRLVLDLKQQGIPAVVIGKATADNDRVVINEDERRFLEPLRAGVQVYGMEFKI